MAHTTLTLPIVNVQPSFETVISEVNSGWVPFDKFWISCYKTSKPSVHAKVHVELDEKNRNLVLLKATDGDVDIRKDVDKYSISCPSLSIPYTKVLTPKSEYSDPQRAKKIHPIKAFDVAPDGSQFATGFHDGTVHLYSTFESSATVKSHSKPHISSVSSLQFFPSSRVLLTAGADFALTILPAEPPTTTEDPLITPVRKLLGHTRAVSSTAIISRGRNVLSASKDGTARLWDVSSAQQLACLTTGRGSRCPILALTIGDMGAEHQLKPPDGEESGDKLLMDDREVETLEKIAWCALQDGSFETFDLGSKQSIYRSPPSGSPLGSIAFSAARHLLATGTSDGVVAVYDTRSLSTPLTSFCRNSASIEALEILDNGNLVGLAIAAEDGLPYIAGVMPEGPEVLTELVGGDCDGVRSVKARGEGGTEVWTAWDDGVVRKYVR